MTAPPAVPAAPLDAEDREITRIRAEYERRRKEIPPDFYSWGRPTNLFFDTQLVRDCIATLKSEGMFPLEGRRVADIGCGSGRWLLEFAQWEATELHGIELDEGRLQKAKARLSSTADLHAGDARFLPWASGSFDLVSQFTLFSSILSQPVKQQVAAEMLRVLKPGGLVLWFDLRMNNPRNPNVRGLPADEIHSLFPRCDVRLRRVTLAPPIARFIVPISWTAAVVLEKIPFLQTHYLAVIRKPA